MRSPALSSIKTLPQSATMFGRLGRAILPHWLADYRSTNLRYDLAAGLTVAVLLVPQSMAYALLGGLPPVVGLYASFLPLLSYAWIGTSRQLAVGPTAMDSLLVMAGASAIAPVGSPEFLVAATLLAALAGSLQVIMGMLKLGSLANFLSQPVLGGFTAAAALVIAGTQLGTFGGVQAPRAATLHESLRGLIPQLPHIHVPTLTLSGLSLLALLALKRWAPRLPGSLLVLALATTATYLLRLDEWGVRVVGHVPKALPHFALPTFDGQLAAQLLPTAAMIALVGFTEAISVARSLAEKHRQHVDADREMMALGLANIGASLSAAYPVTGGLSRSAVADDAGARTQLTGVFAALAIGATLLWFTPLFYYLPQGALSALVVLAALGLISGREPQRLWGIRPIDAVLWGVTFAITLFVGIGQGISVGVLASLGTFIYRSTHPHTAELGCLPNTSTFRNLENYPRAQIVPGVLFLRMDASLYFANTAFFKSQTLAVLAKAKRPIHSVVIDGSGLNDLDCSAESALRELTTELRERGLALYFANLRHPVFEMMQRAGFTDFVGSNHFFLDLASAAAALSSSTPTPQSRLTSLDSAGL